MTVRERQASVRARRKKRGRRLMIAYALRGAIFLLLALMIILILCFGYPVIRIKIIGFVVFKFCRKFYRFSNCIKIYSASMSIFILFFFFGKST